MQTHDYTGYFIYLCTEQTGLGTTIQTRKLSGHGLKDTTYFFCIAGRLKISVELDLNTDI